MAYSYTTEALYSGEHVRGMDMTPETIPCFIQRRNSYQKVIICLAVTSALSLSMATQFLRCRGGHSLLVSAVRFSDGQEAFFIDYSGAKYTRFPPKIAVAQNHCFG